MIARRRGRILRVVPGYNPNSSSLGVDVSFLLFGSVAVTAATLIVSAVVRSWRSRGVPKAEGPSPG